jgi:hypothetical protein
VRDFGWSEEEVKPLQVGSLEKVVAKLQIKVKITFKHSNQQYHLQTSKTFDLYRSFATLLNLQLTIKVSEPGRLTCHERWSALRGGLP